MAARLIQAPLPWLPDGAAEVARGVGLVAGEDGSGAVWVHGMLTFCWEPGDEAGRRLAALQLVQTGAAKVKEVAAAWDADPSTVWQWKKALHAGGVAALIPGKRGPKGPSKLTPELTAAIRELSAAGMSQAVIAARTGVSEFAVRTALGRVKARPAAGGEEREDDAAGSSGGGQEQGELPVLPDPVPRDGERALARFGLLGEGAAPVFAPGAKYPLAGLLLALPALAETGLAQTARGVYGRLKNGFYGLEMLLVTLVFLALLREPRAEGATRVPPRWAGCWAWTGHRRSRRSAASSASSPPRARPRTGRWRSPATTRTPGRTPSASSTSTGTPAPASGNAMCRRCTSRG